MTDKVKAKRKLTDISFEKEGAHLALVHKVQGGAANGYSTLVMKATDKYSEEFIQKASQVKVTLSLPDFLEKFFHVWGDDAEILASLFGYTPSEDTEDEYDYESFWCWYRDKAAAEGNLDYWGDPTTRATDADKQDWLQEQLKGIEILKSATIAKGTTDFIASLTEDQYLNLLKDQEFIEKSFTKKEEQTKDTDLTKSKSGGTPNNTKAITADTKGNKMETIEKAQYDAQQVELQKALADIQKAKEEIELFKAKEKASIEKAREETLKAAVQEDEASAKLFNAIKDLDESAFTEVVDVVKSLVAKLDEADLFKEKGTPESNVKVVKSSVQAELDKLKPKA